MDKAILCVDDEPIILMAMKMELRRSFGSEFLYESATDGDQALETIGALAEDGVKVVLLISDWLMPGMKGDELVTEVGRRFPGIRAIIVTGHADKEKIGKLRQDASLSAVLTKPWAREALVGAVRVALGDS
jgi:CheY-like chemotaxis protein